MKYIVKNCPSCYYIYSDKEYECNFRGSGITKPCRDKDDCLIKRVIERCLAVRDKYCFAEKLNPRWQDANEILNMFEIERVKE